MPDLPRRLFAESIGSVRLTGASLNGRSLGPPIIGAMPAVLSCSSTGWRVGQTQHQSKTSATNRTSIVLTFSCAAAQGVDDGSAWG